MATGDKIDAGLCAQMIEHASHSCANAPPAPPADAQANLDALAVAVTAQGSAVASQSNAIAISALVIGVIALVSAVTWGWFLRQWARDSAQRTVKEWMDQYGPDAIAKLTAQILPREGTSSTPAEQAEGLGEEPT